MTAKTIGLKLEPLDVLFFRESRPFTGAARNVSTLPLPQTMAGAIRTALLRQAGCDFKILGQVFQNGVTFSDAVKGSCKEPYHWIGQVAVRGPWLARAKKENGFDVLVPMPAILHREKNNPKNLYRLSPLNENEPLPGWDKVNSQNDQRNLRPLWLKHLQATEPVNGYLTQEGLKEFLNGETVAAGNIVVPEALFDWDYRTGIEIEPDRLVAAESQIFSPVFLALKEGVFLYIEIILPDGAPEDSILGDIQTLPLGGEGRHVKITKETPISWPTPATHQKQQKPLILMTTPCVFKEGWKPTTALLDGQIVSAAVPSPLAFSGWDLARGGPKPTRFAAPAGSVYFLDSLPNELRDTLAESDADIPQGWGCYVKGVWNDD